MFRKLLIANRGEIACRIIRTARRMGLTTIAVFSDADADALHVEMADEAWRIGEAPARESYRSIERLLDTARRSGAEALHPGYGFLAESAKFAQCCIDRGLIFVGPSPSTMRAVGDKASAKKLMREIGVRTLSGYDGEDQSPEIFARAARSIGFPVLVKASAGGGGRGMRVVHAPEALPAALESAAREAQAAFGNGRLLLEKYIERPRHVEVQFVADRLGAVALFGERDCSLQRNHQKIVEETPAPNLPDVIGSGLQEATARIARACDYVGAGTAEFLVHDAGFVFLEVNARLQVEHPVTEMASGVDLVEWQLRVACGEALPCDPEQIAMRGCAMEARLCAEDPARDFLPSSGVVTHLRLPGDSPRLRVEIGVRAGDRISTHYDSLLAKIVVWEEDRDAALRALRGALDAVELVGVETNLDLLRRLLRDARFIAGEADVGLVGDLAATGDRAQRVDEKLLLAAAAADWRERHAARAGMHDPASPWSSADGWRLYGEERRRLAFFYAGRKLDCAIGGGDAQAFQMETAQGSILVRALRKDGRVTLALDDMRRELGLVPQEGSVVVIVDGRNHLLEWIDPLAPPRRAAVPDAAFTAPVPARVIRILVKKGDRIARGAPMVLLEAMKMEIPIKAPGAGIIDHIYCGEGQSVNEGEALLAWRAVDDAA